MNIIYSKENIFRRLNSTKNVFKSIFDEDFFIVDIIYAFNNLSMEEQDFYLTYKPDKKNKDYEVNKEKMKEITDKMRESILNGGYRVDDRIRVMIKNPTFRLNRPKTIKKESNVDSEITEGNKLIKNKIINLDDILDDNFSDDEKRVIRLKYSEEPPLNNVAVALRLCIDTDEVLETTNKLYKTVFQAHKKLVLMRESSNERKS